MTTEIWVADSQALGAIDRSLLNILEPAEEERAKRYRRGLDARNHLISRILLRSALSRLLGGDPREWRFITGDTGKVMLAHRPGVPFVDFSISHCDGAVAIAVSRSGKIGIDVESLEAEQVFAREEVRRSSGLIRLWTRKEAYSKLLGMGINADCGLGSEADVFDAPAGIAIETHDLALSSGNYQLSVATTRSAEQPSSSPRVIASWSSCGQGAVHPRKIALKTPSKGRIPLWLLPARRLAPAR